MIKSDQNSGRSGILLVAFGPGTPQAERALRLFGSCVEHLFPDLTVRWAYTSERIRTRLSMVRKKSDSVAKALYRMQFERYRSVAIQSLHVIPGHEYELLQEEVEEVQRSSAMSLALGAPLLANAGAVDSAAAALVAEQPVGRCPEEAIVYIGHGTWHQGAVWYAKLEKTLQHYDSKSFIGTLEGEQGFVDILTSVKGVGASKVWLVPLLSTIGKHVEVDILGLNKLSWRSRFESQGMACEGVLRGMVEYRQLRTLWLEHLYQAVSMLNK